jgi:hypothetical protein
MNNMNTWQHLEEQFRSWTPRPPSARLKKRIFAERLDGQAGNASAEVPFWARANGWQWFAPAMAVFMLALGLSSPGSGGFTQLILSPMNGKMGSMALQDADLSTYVSSSSHSSHNGWPIATFEWTNQPKPVTTTSPVREAGNTNRLMR